MAATERRRRVASLVAALLTAVGASLLLTAPAEAQNCPILEPNCSPVSTGPSTTAKSSTTTIDDGEDTTTTTTTVEDEPTDTTIEDTEPVTTVRGTPTTEEEVTTTTFAVSTSINLLVPGDGTAGAESTTTTEPAPPEVAGQGGLSDNQLVAVIVTGFGTLALAVGLLTWRYWRATQPVEVEVEPTPRGGRREAPPEGPRTHRSVFLDP